MEVILTQIIPVAYAALEKAYREGILSDEILDRHVLKVLRTKERLGLEVVVKKCSIKKGLL
ncbi:hypothetical protein NEPTK9_000426 [Candidatus Neptunochlamydia vexilliferae]|uniref:Uncharacterized protein n=1 Tax=Candidatus Neptunichlamydia vexilliferae TaxID=1651774 RepID=A0ABS0AZN2_9BACT|nr:hypothetical protein [Candidatus Neptunochlamydia vexilliferae]